MQCVRCNVCAELVAVDEIMLHSAMCALRAMGVEPMNAAQYYEVAAAYDEWDEPESSFSDYEYYTELAERMGGPVEIGVADLDAAAPRVKPEARSPKPGECCCPVCFEDLASSEIKARQTMSMTTDKSAHLSEEEFDKLTWTVVEELFAHNQGAQLVKHQTDSYNDFVLRKMEQVIEGFNTVEVHHQYLPDLEGFRYTLRINVQNPVLSKPVILEKDGSSKIMTPADARQRNLVYAMPLHVDVRVNASTMQDDGSTRTETKTLRGVNIGKLPIMVGSKYSVLTSMRSVEQNECKHELGGYFIINGNEKVVISQDRIAENKTHCFSSNKLTYYSHIAEIRSVKDNVFGVPKATTLKLSAKSNHVGVESDRDICRHILHDLDSPASRNLMEHLVGSAEDANMVRTERQALEYLSKYMNISGYPREVLNHPDKRIGILKSVLVTDLLLHVGPEYGKKALYLGYMARKLLRCYLGFAPFDDRDSYINKRIDTPGVLLTNLFRQYYGKLIKDMHNLLQKEITTGSWKATNRFINVLSQNNVLKIIKPNTIEPGLKYCLSTGTWGIKNARNKQGIAQVLNRLTYNATLSHLRRINTPMEKTGELVQPQKLHNT
uniref:DNA-directed RNA polymerase n=1 Tax=Tetradesmus obliquus TaxID=3088 RepID=A0A383W3M4_TETOB|eukprot:jgi/Sobl393_1/17210/SZX72267.1